MYGNATRPGFSRRLLPDGTWEEEPPPSSSQQGNVVPDPNVPPEPAPEKPPEKPKEGGGAPPPPAGPPPTFAQLQTAGIARPAPPVAAIAGSPNRDFLMQQIAQMLSNPSSYGTEDMRREVEAGGRKIDDQYSLEDQRLREELVKRGLGQAEEGTIGLGRLSDLNIGKRSAMTELQDRLLTKLAETRAGDMRAAIAQAMGLEHLVSGEQQFSADLGFRRESLAAQMGDSAADRGLRREQFEYGKTQDTADRAQRESEFARQFGLSEREVALREKDSDLDRAYREWDKQFKEKGFTEDTRQFDAEMEQRKKEAEMNDLLDLLRELFGQDFLGGGGSGGSGGGSSSGYGGTSAGGGGSSSGGYGSGARPY